MIVAGMGSLVGAAAVTAAICIGIVAMTRRGVISIRRQLDDLHDVQSTHVTPAPRLGGVAVMASFVLFLILMVQN